MPRYLTASACAHLLLFLSLAVEVLPQEEQPIEVHVVEIEKKKIEPVIEKKDPAPIPPAGVVADEEPLEIGNGADLSELSLDERLQAENYNDRIRAMVEPWWFDRIRERLRIRQSRCVAVIRAVVASSGEVVEVQTVSGCKDKQIEAISHGALRRHYNLPPPPKNLLRGGKLVITWTFSVQ